MYLRSNYPAGPIMVRTVPMAKTLIRIAVVDDDASVRRALGRFLRATSFDAETYGSGAEFLAALHAFRPHCIVLDLHMEGMNGLDVQRHLSRIGGHLPVIIISGHDNPRAQAEALALGADAFLPKPVDGNILVSTIERVIGEASQPA